MSVQDFIKKSILESGAFDQATVLEISVGLLTALLVGALIYLVSSFRRPNVCTGCCGGHYHDPADRSLPKAPAQGPHLYRNHPLHR